MGLGRWRKAGGFPPGKVVGQEVLERTVVSLFLLKGQLHLMQRPIRIQMSLESKWPLVRVGIPCGARCPQNWPRAILLAEV